MVITVRGLGLLLFFIIPFLVLSQNPTPISNKIPSKALEHFKKGSLLELESKLDLAIDQFKKARNVYPEYQDATLKMGFLYCKMKKYKSSVEEYQKYYLSTQTKEARILLALANSLFFLDEFNRAKEICQQILKDPKAGPNIRTQAEKVTRDCDFALKSPLVHSKCKMNRLPDQINSKYWEYFPTLSGDGAKLFFTRNMGGQEDFYVSIKGDQGWSESLPVKELNTAMNEGAGCLSSDGKTFIFTICDHPKGLGRCDLFISHLVNGKWDQPSNLGFGVNSAAWESQPSLSSDGRLLIFVSDRGGSKDLYLAQINDQGTWSKAVKLPDNVNTSGLEDSPYFSADGETLYFSSDGHPGFGGADLFLSRRININQWTNPINLGSPINTKESETTLIVNLEGGTGIFARDSVYFVTKKDIYTEQRIIDLYSFELPASMKPRRATYVEGVVFDKISGKTLSASILLQSIQSPKLNLRPIQNPDGTFFAALQTGKTYSLFIEKKGYTFYSDKFEVTDTVSLNTPYKLKIYLVPFTQLDSNLVGQSIQLKNIFFANDSYKIEPTSIPELQKLLQFLNDNPTVRIQINGHTDSIGNDGANQILSENRAKAIVDYLVKEGIQNTRVRWKGFGETQPIQSNDTSEGKAANRRTEILFF